jgi:hypothetical protein
MRIKSYFAPSVQSAISIARKEFGDEVTLVTSHTAALESRHLGDYEVVFAVDEPAPLEPAKPTQIIKAAAASAVPTETLTPQRAPEPIAEAPPFEQVLHDAITTPLSTEEDIPQKLEQVQTLLVEMGIDGPMVRALMTMIERTVGSALPAPNKPDTANETSELETPETECSTAVETSTDTSTPPDLTPAELAFYLSVSVGS